MHFEVTSESFLQFKREGGYRERRYWSEEGWRVHERRPDSYPTLPEYHVPRIPRVKLSWYEAEAYAAWRGGALPTEASTFQVAVNGCWSGLRWPTFQDVLCGAGLPAQTEIRVVFQ